MIQFRSIHTKMWRDSWFSELDAEGKLLWVYLITNGAASLTGIYYLSIKFAAFETGLGQERVQTLMAQFVLAGKIEYENEVVWIRRMRRYQAANESSPKIKPRIEKDLSEIPDCKVKRLYLAQYPIDTVSIPSHTDTDTDTDTKTKPIGANAPVSPESQNKTTKGKGRKPKTPNRQRERDVLFDAIAEVCCVDPATAGASIGNVKVALLQAKPPYSADEVRAFGKWHNSDEFRRKKGPPSLWQLKEKIGIVRNGNGSGASHAPSHNGNNDPNYADLEYLRLNPKGKGRADAIERLKARGYDVAAIPA